MSHNFGDVPDARDIEIVSAQLGRPARGIVAIASRCVCVAPLVVVTSPVLPDGTPFPTLFYLTNPAATAAVSRLEADRVMSEFEALLAEDAEIAKQYAQAHREYLADRDRLGSPENLSGFSAGGMPSRVKCLHALVGHSLAKGRGVNPIGDLALERLKWSPSRCECLPEQRGHRAGVADGV